MKFDRFAWSSKNKKGYTMRELRPLELLAVLFLLWIISFLFDANSSTMVIVMILTGITIVPHGAIDLALARELSSIENSSVRLGIFFTIYMILAISFWLIWPYFPNVCLSIFWLTSIIHFGHNDRWKSSSKLVTWSSFLLCGTLPLFQSGFWHEKETVSLVTAMGVEPAVTISHMLKLGGCLWFVGAAVFAVHIVYQGNYHQKLMEIVVLVMTFAILTPELGFLFYTATVHAPRHLKKAIPRAIAAHPSGKKGLTEETTVILLITFALAVWILTNNISLSQDTALIRLTFIGLAALTLPHMLLIDLALLKRREI